MSSFKPDYGIKVLTPIYSFPHCFGWNIAGLF
jgi:hypothetical protein